MDHQGWYELTTKEKSFRKIEDIIFICAMGPPGGGRSQITRRFERHFNIITYTNLQQESIKIIFNTIVAAYLGDFGEKIAANLSHIVDMTLNVYNTVAAELKPTPNKSHYTFNLRDISKVFQGLCSAYKKTTELPVDLARLWIHENKRVFGDRMVSHEDREKLDNLVNDECQRVL